MADHIQWDKKLHGFGLRTRDGNRSWVFQYKFDGKHRRIKLGGPELSRDSARQLALAERGKLAKARLGHGFDPATERDQKRLDAKPKRSNSFAVIIPIYLEARRGGLKDSTYEAQALHLNKHWSDLHRLTLDAITRADVAGVLSKIGKNYPIAANRARSTLSKFFVWAIGEGLTDQNPVTGTNKRDENDPRERSLSDSETATVWLTAPNNDYGRIVRLILLTGCRRTELGDLKWSETDLESRTITLPKDRTKNGREHVVPLSDAAMGILKDIERGDREYVFGRTSTGGFSGWSKAKREFDMAVKFDDWTLHDLRRTVRTGLGKLGLAPHIAEAVINHLPPKLVRTYDTHTYETEKRDALDRWATHLKTIVAQATGANVTTLKR